MAARGKTGSPGRASPRSQVSHRGCIYGAENLRRCFENCVSEGRGTLNEERTRLEEALGGERVCAREDTVENWGQDENRGTRQNEDESENSWAKQFPRRVDAIEGIGKISASLLRILINYHGFGKTYV